MTTVDTPTPWWPWTPADPAEWLRNWSEAMRSAPQAFTQAMNPGWNFGPTFTLNNGNSSAPQTEVEVLQRVSTACVPIWRR